MYTWQHIEPLPEEPHVLRSAAAKIRLSINAAIASLLKTREQFDKDSAGDDVQIRAMSATLIEILNVEISLRERILNDWAGVRSAERNAALDRARLDHAAVRADVTKTLVAVGFTEGPALERMISLAQCHPRISTAREAETTADLLCQDGNADWRRHEIEINRARGEIDRVNSIVWNMKKKANLSHARS